MWKKMLILMFVLTGCFGIYWLVSNRNSSSILSPIGKITQKPLEKYTIGNLSKRTFVPTQIVFDNATATTSSYTVYNFHYLSDGLKVTGVAHLPNGKSQKFPVIVQFRGYVDQTQYFPGEGTQRSAEVFAQNGFLTLAPDFLGYGGSASPSSNVFEERFQTYTTALNLLASVGSITVADASRVGIWGHSNGGQIALTVLEILGSTRLPAGRQVPATLWAPVSKPFPYSILYYTDEAEDHGKLLRRELAQFEKDYDVELYSLTNYLGRIAGPLQIHQGTADDAVPQKWSDELVKAIEKTNKNVSYFVYPVADHNMTGSPARNASQSDAGGWNTVVSRDVLFFQKYLNKE